MFLSLIRGNNIIHSKTLGQDEDDINLAYAGISIFFNCTSTSLFTGSTFS
jgi:hypothetical protein